MSRPTEDQLTKINRLAKKNLNADQVFVFRSLSADTLPVKQYGWFGEYAIIFSSKMLTKLREDYKKGAALLASHNRYKLPFGRTFDAVVEVDQVGGELVDTLYIDQYMVTYVEDSEGNKQYLPTEVNGLTTQDIANHIDSGHTFDTSIGFSIDKAICSVCGHDLRSEKCMHYPGKKYEVDDSGTMQRCDVLADYGEGIENSIVYAGAVDRATITNGRFSEQGNDDSSETTLIVLDDIKSVPLHATIYGRYSKGSLTLYSNFKSKSSFHDISEGGEFNKMGMEKVLKKFGIESESDLEKVLEKYQSFSQGDSLKLATGGVYVGEEKEEEFNKKLDEMKADYESRLEELKAELAVKDGLIEELTEQQEEYQAQAEVVAQYREDLVEDTVKMAVRVLGNGFNVERYKKYLATLSIEEVKEEFASYKEQRDERFSGSRVSTVTTEEVRYKNEEPKHREDFDNEEEFRKFIAGEALKLSRENGTNIAEETEKLYREFTKKV